MFTESEFILIVGAGPTGLTTARELQRRGVPFRLIEKSPTPFQGSRGKGLQPRTQARRHRRGRRARDGGRARSVDRDARRGASRRGRDERYADAWRDGGRLGSAARIRGGLSSADFVKVISVQKLSQDALRDLAPAITTLARAEGLEAHARSVEVRLGK